MLPDKNIIAHVELNESVLEYFLEKLNYDSSLDTNFEEWVQILISYDNPIEAYLIQGKIAFYNLRTKFIIETEDTECKLVKDIISIYTNREELECIKSLALVS